MTEREVGPLGDYRRSHAQAGYGLHYSRTYQSGYYAKLWNLIEGPLVERRLAAIAAKGVDSALDFACGTGRITSVLERHFERVLGVDVSVAMLDIARAKTHKAELRHVDITECPLTESFGVATAFRFFLNAEPVLRSAAMEAIRQSLRPGGWLLANVHVTRSSPLGIAYRARNLAFRRVVANTMGVDELVRLGAAHNMEAVHVDWYGALPRVGRLSDGLLLAAMMPAERIFASLSFVPRKLAQTAMVTFRRR